MIRWSKQGEARVLLAKDDRVTVLSTVASAPGSRIEGVMPKGSMIRIKVNRCKLEEGVLSNETPTESATTTPPCDDLNTVSAKRPLYRIEGKLLDATRATRDEVLALAANKTRSYSRAL